MFNQPWAVRNIQALDPGKDATEIAHLLFEIVFGEPILVHLILNYAFANDMTIPSIMKVVHRNGKGAVHKDPKRRMDDTINFVSAFLDYKNPVRREQLMKKMNRIHGQYPIVNEQMKFVSGTFIFDAPHIVNNVIPGKQLFTDKENIALFNFWKGVAEDMSTTGIPDSFDEFKKWYYDYRNRHAVYSDGCRAVAIELANEWTSRWFPKPLHFIGHNLFYACFDEVMFQSTGIRKPPVIYKKLLQLAVMAVIIKGRYLWNPEPGTNLRQFFQKDYDKRGLDFLQHGGYVMYKEGDTYTNPELSARAKCPFSSES